MRTIAITLLLALAAGPTAAAPDAAAPRGPASANSAWLGVWLGDAVDGGVQIVALVPGGPAEQAGLQAGDVLLQADGHELAREADLSAVLDGLRVGGALEFLLLRGGEEISRRVITGQRGAAGFPLPLVLEIPPVPRIAPVPSVDRLESLTWGAGAEVAEITPGLREHYGAPAESGVLVTRVEPDGLAERWGWRVGDVVVTVGETPVRTPLELRSAVGRWGRQRTLKATIIRDRTSRVTELDTVRPRAAPEPEAAIEARRRAVKLQIERLEQRIADLKRELEELNRERD